MIIGRELRVNTNYGDATINYQLHYIVSRIGQTAEQKDLIMLNTVFFHLLLIEEES